MTFKEQIELYLKDVPSKWKKQLTEVLCEINATKTAPTCAEIKECETLTSLSTFSVSGTVVSIQYKDENGVTVTRSFDASGILNSLLDGLDPNCLATQSEWDEMTFDERIQLLIDAHCDCCTSSTTTTTTEA